MRPFCSLTTALLLPVFACASVPAGLPLVPTPEEYSRLCRELNAVTGCSLAEIRTGLSSLSGKYVEIRGKVLGTAHAGQTEAGVVDMYLKCGDDSCFIPSPRGIAELQPGRSVRLLLRVPEGAADIDECTLKAVAEDTSQDDQRSVLEDAGDKRLEIGEAAHGVRDRVPVTNLGPGSSLPRQAGHLQTHPAVPVSVPPGAALPPEMRAVPSVSGQTAAQAPAKSTSPPQVRPVDAKVRDYEQAVRIWANWIRSQNPQRTPQEADLIVRWVLYYSALNQVDHRLVFAVMKYESNFDPRCVSRAGAMGLMQLMECNVKDFNVKDPFDIAENIRGGIEHLAEFLRKYQGKSYYEQTVLALACYNAGPGAVAKYGGVPPYAETQSYVRKVPALFAQLVKQGYP